MTFVRSALAAAAALACACGGKSSAPAEPSVADRLAVLNAALARVESLVAQGPSFDYPAVQAALLQDPAVQLVGTSDDGALWVQVGGGPLAVVAIDPTPVPTALAPATPASRAGARVLSSAPAALAAAPSLPDKATYRAYFGLGTAFKDPTPDVARILESRGYTAEASGPPNVEALRGVSGTGVLFVKTHGKVMDSPNPQTGANLPFYALYTSTPYPDPAEEQIAGANGDWTHQRITVFTALNKKAWDPSNASETHYAITERFVTQYMSFASGAVVFIDACKSGQGTASRFIEAFLSKGASVYLGWDANVDSNASDGTARYLFDRLSGANDASAKPESPPQRPFDLASLGPDIVSKGLNQAGGANLVFDGNAILAPSLSFVEVNEQAQKLTLHGLFGTKQDKVTVGSGNVAVTSWAAGQIVTALPSGGGDVVVSVDGRKSNAVQLTDWNGGTIKYTMKYDAGANGSLQQVVTWTPHFRADVHSYRTQPGQAAPPRSPVAFQAAQDSQCSYDNSGTVVDSQGPAMTWSGAGSLPESPSPDMAGSGCFVAGAIDPASTATSIPATVFAHAAGGLTVAIAGLPPSSIDLLPNPLVYTTMPWGVTLTRDSSFAVGAGTSTPNPVVVSGGGVTALATLAWTAIPAASPPDPNGTE